MSEYKKRNKFLASLYLNDILSEEDRLLIEDTRRNDRDLDQEIARLHEFQEEEHAIRQLLEEDKEYFNLSKQGLSDFAISEEVKPLGTPESEKRWKIIPLWMSLVAAASVILISGGVFYDIFIQKKEQENTIAAFKDSLNLMREKERLAAIELENLKSTAKGINIGEGVGDSQMPGPQSTPNEEIHSQQNLAQVESKLSEFTVDEKLAITYTDKTPHRNKAFSAGNSSESGNYKLIIKSTNDVFEGNQVGRMQLSHESKGITFWLNSQGWQILKGKSHITVERTNYIGVVRAYQEQIFTINFDEEKVYKFN
ncbi:hypothetical protein [Dyadobacter frigoris]|uniref:Uncharacterized protein n=1 Tax=Dyadobacter frigoris TaxID=2576211 RepID=A0A4V6BIK7_9BACT|nr:hypothetical protein [Dyadobacter frigoris]TKT85263.1 hypothetical protein FDK13_34285 [Dyadobacter frigoris]